MDLYLRQQWEDTRLQYEVHPQDGIEEVFAFLSSIIKTLKVSLPASRQVWTPDTYFSTANEKPQAKSRRSIVVEPSGHVRSSEQ